MEIFVALVGLTLLMAVTRLLRWTLAFPRWVSGMLLLMAVSWGGFLFYFFVLSSGVPMTPDFNLRAWSGVFVLLYLSCLTKPKRSGKHV